MAKHLLSTLASTLSDLEVGKLFCKYSLDVLRLICHRQRETHHYNTESRSNVLEHLIEVRQVLSFRSLLHDCEEEVDPEKAIPLRSHLQLATTMTFGKELFASDSQNLCH